MGLIIWAVLLGILIPIVYSILRKWYVSLGITLSCGITSALFFLIIDGYLPTDVVGGDYASMVFSPSYLIQGAHLESLFVSIFVHANLLHIGFNVIGLVMFGLMLEERIGGMRTLAVFLIGAIGGELFFSIFYWGSAGGLVGASGGIMAIVGAFARLYPYEKVSVFGLFMMLRNAPAWMMALVFVMIDLVLAIINTSVDIQWFGGQVAYLAHVGGLLAGFAVAPLVMKAKVTERIEEIDIEVVKKVIPDEKSYADIVRSVRGEKEREVVEAWLAKIEGLARCPKCKQDMRIRGAYLTCERGHKVRISK